MYTLIILSVTSPPPLHVIRYFICLYACNLAPEASSVPSLTRPDAVKSEVGTASPEQSRGCDAGREWRERASSSAYKTQLFLCLTLFITVLHILLIT